jgi:glycyl-tRNA synthetase
MANEERLKTLSGFLQQQGFVWGPEPEIYGGVAGFYTYGPNGALLKRRVEDRIRAVFAKHSIFEVETPTVLPKPVWEASGHLGGFSDPLIRDNKGSVFRADKIVEEFYASNEVKEPVPGKDEELLAAIKKHSIPAPSKEAWVMKIERHSLMMKTTIGTDVEAYNRPETATATYLPFARYVEHFRKRLPFAVFQIGKAYRNEISPRQHLLRMREFTQAEAQVFVDPTLKNDWQAYGEVKKKELPILSWAGQEGGEGASVMTLEKARTQFLGSDAYAWSLYLAYELFRSFGIPEERLRLRQHGPDEKAFYAADAWDVEIDLPTFGWTETCGVHDRTDYDLTQHAKHSGQALEVFVEERREKVVPHVLEIAFGVDRPVYALLDIFYDDKKANEGKSTLRLPYNLAPVQVAVLPLVKKLAAKADEVLLMLRQEGFVVAYDDAGSIGKRYLRQSVIGTPYCVTIDFDTLEGDNAGTVTLRDRDTEAQERVSADELSARLKTLLR